MDLERTGSFDLERGRSAARGRSRDLERLRSLELERRRSLDLDRFLLRSTGDLERPRRPFSSSVTSSPSSSLLSAFGLLLRL